MWMTSLFIVLLFSIAISDGSLSSIALQNEHNYSKTANCVLRIIEKYYEPHSILTFVKFRAMDMNILRYIHATGYISVVNRTPYFKNPLSNKGYLICVRNAGDFITKFRYVIAEKTWMPYAPFLIVVQNLDVAELQDIFEELLRALVKNAIVLDAFTTDSYTYDPFENNACGKRFDRIIKLGKCLSEMPPGQFPNKMENGLQNCNLKLAMTHWPPYAIDPSKSVVNATGIDEYLFQLLAEHGKFKLNISYVEDIADVVSVVDDEMVADGPLHWLQTKTYDVVTGGIVLLVNRAPAFTYLYSHSAYDDEFRVIVRQADDMPKWKMIFLEFSPLVWLLLFMTFTTVSVLIICLTRPKDKSFIILSLFDNMLQHSCRIRRNRETRFIILIWIIFASLIANCYLCGLFSLTAKSIPDYQVNKLPDLNKYELQPCVSKAMHMFQNIVSALDGLEIDDVGGTGPGCKRMNDSLRTVSNSDNMYTVVPYSLYYSDRYQYYDESGKNLLYSFRQPLSKIIYASYMSKGFPLYDKFHLLSLRMREAGLVLKLWNEYEYEQKKYYNVTQYVTHSQFYLPIYVIIFGWIISTLCFIGEILAKKYEQRHIFNI